MQNEKKIERAQPRGQRPPGTSLEQRLKAGVVVDPKTGCHVWRGGGRRTYGALMITAHRLAWEMANGPIPEGMLVLHKCDNPRCCNPDHLCLGTQLDNMADMSRKGRARNRYTGKAKTS
jgi:HNH endonuclease